MKKLRVIGRAAQTNDNATKLKSAKPYVKKQIYGVYNVESSESVSSIESFVEESCGCKLISCFQIKSRDTNSVVFRVCIDALMSENFLNEDIWANGVVIRPWTFKPKAKPTDIVPVVMDQGDTRT